MRSVLATLLTLAVVGCGNRAGDAVEAPGGWVTIEGVDFPARMAKAPPEVQEAYVFAAKHPEVLHYMPCYCGCENESPPHTSNYDCFVDQINRTGERPRVEIDAMGFG